MWTQFIDMHSGGGKKLDWEHIYIEASEEDAKQIFFAMFGRSPDNVTCPCCGNDYSISEHEDLYQATGFERGCKFDNELQRYVEQASDRTWTEFCTLEDYMLRTDVLFIHAASCPQGEHVVSVDSLLSPAQKGR